MLDHGWGLGRRGRDRAVNAWTVERFGELSVVFANARVNGMLAPIEELTLDEWHQVVETTLTRTFLTIKHAIPISTRPAVARSSPPCLCTGPSSS